MNSLVAKQIGRRPRSTRIEGESSTRLCDRTSVQTHALSQRQLPTEIEHVGVPQGMIHEYQTDQPSQ
jgi:hypothetical protein